MRRLIGLLALAACAGEPPASYEDAAEAVSGLTFDPARERQVARLLVNAPLNEDTVEAALAPARPALGTLASASRAEAWALTGAPRASREAWEALAWLGYGDARLALRDDPEAAWDRALTTYRLGVLMGDAEGAGVADLVASFTLREAGLVQLQRLAAVAPPTGRRARTLARTISEEVAGLGAWTPAMRAEAAQVGPRLAAMADDPITALGLAGERLGPKLAGRAPSDILDVRATEEAVTGLFLRAAAMGPADCETTLAPDAPPRPDGANPGGRLLAHQTALALAALFDRVCQTEAARRATLIALGAEEGGTDPFTGARLLVTETAVVSGGRDRVVPTEPGPGPFDGEAPTWWLDDRALVSF